MSEMNLMMAQMMQLMMGDVNSDPYYLDPRLPYPRHTQILIHCKGCDEMVFDVHDPSDLCEGCCYCNDGEGAACNTYCEGFAV